MAFTDNSSGRLILAGFLPVRITLTGTVRTGDPVGYSSGWKAADGNNSVYAELVAGQHGSSGDVITCYRIARVGGITSGTAGNALYLSDTAGSYSASAGTVSQRIGFELGNSEMLIEPKDIVLTRANQLDWSDIEAVSGDITINDSGVAAIGADKVLDSMVAPKHMKVLTGSLASGNANAFAFAVQNPEDAKVLIHKVIIDITTAGGTGSSVLNVGIATSATGTGDTIFDGVDLNSAAISVSTNVSDTGTNGNEKVHKMDENAGTNDYITGKILVANAASLVGNYYIFYTEVA